MFRPENQEDLRVLGLSASVASPGFGTTKKGFPAVAWNPFFVDLFDASINGTEAGADPKSLPGQNEGPQLSAILVTVKYNFYIFRNMTSLHLELTRVRLALLL